MCEGASHSEASLASIARRSQVITLCYARWSQTIARPSEFVEGESEGANPDVMGNFFARDGCNPCPPWALRLVGTMAGRGWKGRGKFGNGCRSW